VTGIIVVTHERLGEALCRETERIIGHALPVTTMSVGYGADLQTARDNMRLALASGADADGAVVLTDLPGATPHNLAVEAAAERGFPVVSGLNLPMLLKVVNHAAEPPKALAELAAIGGSQGIVSA